MTRKEVQIDIVGAPVEGKEYLIGSCKYKNEKIGVDELELLKRYASVFHKGEKYYYYIFSKCGFTPALQELGKQLWTLIALTFCGLVQSASFQWPHVIR